MYILHLTEESKRDMLALKTADQHISPTQLLVKLHIPALSHGVAGPSSKMKAVCCWNVIGKDDIREADCPHPRSRTSHPLGKSRNMQLDKVLSWTDMLIPSQLVAGSIEQQMSKSKLPPKP